MALVGNLKDLKLVNIIQINCIERNVAKLSVVSSDRRGAIFFSGGNIVHGEFGPFVGEKAVYEMLALQEGQFKVEAGIHAPAQTITQPWNSLVLEGLRLVDEKQTIETTIPKQLFANLSNLKNVKNVFVMDFNGKVVEGEGSDKVHPLFLTFVWYKQRKLLNYFHSEKFHYIQIRRNDGYFFIFEHHLNLILIETGLHIYVPDFYSSVIKVLKQLDFT